MINKNETHEERFKRLATLRTKAILDKLRILGNLSNRQLYDYSEEDVEKIFNALNKQVREIRAKFGIGKQRNFEL